MIEISDEREFELPLLHRVYRSNCELSPQQTVYVGTDGRLYSDEDIWPRLETETWTVCCWDNETGREVVETEEGELLFLTPFARTPQ